MKSPSGISHANRSDSASISIPSFPDSDTRPPVIDTEIQTLQDRYSEIGKHVGKYVLIKGKIVDYFASYREAIAAGYKQFGLDGFLVRQIKAHDNPIRASRCGLTRMGSELHLAQTE